jgi:hypothetical protein
MKKLLLILLCLPFIGFGQKENPVSTENKYCNYLYNNTLQKNIFTILVNSNNQLLVEGELMDISQLKDGATRFINNNGTDPRSSENTESAFFLIESRGTKTIDYEIIGILNRIYAEINIEINQRKICHMRGSVLEEWRRMHSPPPPPPPPPPEVIEIIEDDIEIEDTISDEEWDRDNNIKIFQPPNNWINKDLKIFDHPVEFMDAQTYLFIQLDEIGQKSNYEILKKESKLYNQAIDILETINRVKDAQDKWSSTITIKDRKIYDRDIKECQSRKIMQNIWEKDREIFQDWIQKNEDLFKKYL